MHPILTFCNTLLCTDHFFFTPAFLQVLIFGSYAPHQELVTEDEETSRETYSKAALDEDVPNNSWDPFFFITVRPFLEEGVKYMCWGNGVICALRYFAFLWARVRLIVINGLAEVDEEDQGAESDGAEGGHSKADDEEPEHVWIADLVKGSSEVHNVESSEKEDNNLAMMPGIGIFTTVGIVLRSPMFLYETLYLLMAAGTVWWNEPLLTTIFWVEVFTFQSSQTVVNAILSKIFEMIMTLVLGIAIMYIWMVVGIVLFRTEHEPDDNSVCTNMFQCTLAYIFIALRGDGVKDLMGDLDIPLNVIDR